MTSEKMIQKSIEYSYWFFSKFDQSLLLMTESKYTQEEILQILIDFYNYQSVFDPEVDPGEELNFETTILDWRVICDLVEPEKLAKCYRDLFQLTTPVTELETILSQKEIRSAFFVITWLNVR